MSQEGSSDRRRLLHVAPPTHSGGAAIGEALRAAGMEVVECPDVYRALARLGGAGEGFSRAVVCVDWLTPEQFEFFQIASHQHPGVTIDVYASPLGRGKVELALRLGAAREVTAGTVAQEPDGRLEAGWGVVETGGAGNGRPGAEAVDEAGTAPAEAVAEVPADTSNEPPVERVVEEPIEPPVVRPPKFEMPAVAPDDEAEAEEAAGLAAEADVDEETAEPKSTGTGQRKPRVSGGSTARVPWLRYDDAPQRTPPKKASRPEAQPAPAAAPEPEPPLLSPEELEALMGDQEPDEPDQKKGKRGG